MTTAILLTAFLYIAFSLFLGVRAHRTSTHSSEDYFIAGRSLSWVHLGLTLFATWMSTFAFLGSPGFYYNIGVKWYLPHGVLVVASPMLLWFIGRRLWTLGKENGYITPGDLLADFYKSSAVRFLVAIISLLALIPYCLIQLVGIGKALTTATGGAAPYWVGIVFAILGIAIYTYLGGMRAIVWTDILQACMFGAVMLIGVTIVLKQAGGPISGWAESITVKPEAFTFDPSKIGSPITLMIIWTFGYILLPHMWQRAYMAKSREALSKSIVLGTVLALVLIAIPSLLMGTLGIGFMSDIADSDRLVPTIFREFFAYGLPLLMVAVFAAGMSTIDSQLLSASSVVVRDIVRPLRGGRIDSGLERKIGRWVVIVFVSLLTVLAFLPEAQGSIVKLASKGTGIALLLLVPTLGPLAWSRASRAGAVAALAGGGLVLLLLETGAVANPMPLSFGAPVAALIVQAVLLVSGSLLFPRVER